MLGIRIGDDRLFWLRYYGVFFVSCREIREGVDWVFDCFILGSMGGSECEVFSRFCVELF